MARSGQVRQAVDANATRLYATICAWVCSLVAGLVLLIALPGVAQAQITDNPVFPDESPLARDGLAALPSLIASENWPEAVRSLQDLLDQHAERMIEAPESAMTGRGVYITVRERAHMLLRSSPEFLDRYRRTSGPVAMDLLSRGEHKTVERAYFLTPAGVEGTLRTAEEHLQASRFETARLTLEQLETHPDRQGERSVQAGLLLARVASYLDRPAVVARAQAWMGAQTREFPAIQWPESALRRSYEPTLPPADMDPRTVTTAPLRSVMMIDESVFGPVRQAAAQDRRPSWLFPLAVGEKVFINDGRRLQAYDRYSLDLRWQTALAELTESDARALIDMGPGRGANEPTSLAWAPGLVLGVTGVASDTGDRAGDGRLHAVDAETGQVRWAVNPDEIDPRLAGSIFRGPPVIEGDTAVIVARRADASRRSISVFMAGIRLSDGSTAWVRPLASAGSVGYSREIAAGDWPVLHEGIVYLSDRAGAIAAVEAGTGRPHWLRLDLSPPRRVGARPMTWAVHRPLVIGDALVAMSSDRQRLLWIRRTDGALIASRGMSELSSLPQCVIVVDENTIAVVNFDSVAMLPSDPATGADERTPLLTTPSLDPLGLTGRPIALQGKLFVPTANGLVIVDPKDPRRGDRIALERTGNLVALDSQILAADDIGLHSYLVWDVASSVLRERLSAEPDNPDPAITLAELAFRSDRHDQILAPLDDALKIITSIENHPVRERLFDTLREIIESGGRAWAHEGVSILELQGPSFETVEQAQPLVDRLGPIADTPQKRVVYELLAGKLAEAMNQPSRAVEIYQRVLLDDALSETVWTSRELTIGAGREASRRLTQLLKAHGTPVYAEFDRRAIAELASAEGRRDPARVAKRYPVAAAAARAWLNASTMRGEKQDHAGRLAALESSVRVVTLRQQLADPIEPTLAGEILGQTALSLIDSGRLAAARRLLEDAGEQPDVVLTSLGELLDVGGMLEDVGQRLGARGRLPIVGRNIGSSHQLLQGWRVALPLLDDLPRRPDSSIMLVDDRRMTLGLFDVVQGEQAGATQLERRWERPFSSDPGIVHFDEQTLLVYLEDQQGRYFESIDGASGRTVWRIGPINQLIGIPRDPRARGGGVQTALDGWRQPDDLVIAMDQQTLVLVSRNGMIMAISRDNGELQWKSELPVDRVIDVDIADGVVVIAGETTLQQRRVSPRLLLLDSRRGEVLHQLGEQGQGLRWVKATEQGVVVVGMDAGIVGIRARNAETLWSAMQPNAAATFGAWTFEDHLLAVGPNSDLLLGELGNGRFKGPLQGRRGRFDTSSLTAWRDENHLVVASEVGVRIYALDGSLVGADALDSTDGMTRLIQPAPGAGVVLLIESGVTRMDRNTRGTFRAHLIDTTDGRIVQQARLELPEQPIGAALLDGIMVISTQNMTVVVPLE